jgi:TonB dependent receptor/TonB-dependent Receptor Plug Domain
VLRAITTLPGVKTVGEASTGFNVRGGAADQNLILFNNATIFNPSHFFGFFSAFNPDMIKDVELYKSSLPAKYGGRLSSVLDITSREGNKKQFAGSAGIGPLTSRLNIEGPIIKDKLSFIAGARTTYANWLLDILPDQYKNSTAGFSDINLHLSYQMNSRNNFYLTGYYSKDDFRLNSDTTYSYENRNASFKWKHSFNNKFRSELIAGYDRYEYTTGSTGIPFAAYRLAYDIAQITGRADFTWFWNPKHTAEFGITSIRYQLHPGQYDPAAKESLVVPDTLRRENALESAIYLSDKWNITRDFTITAGLRYAMYSFLGPADVNNYAPDLPKNPDNLISTSVHGAGRFIKTYAAPEYRIALRYSFTNDLSIKAGLTSTHQYIHLLSNTAAISPTDSWKLSDPNIAPQYGRQASFGVYKNLKNNTIETSLEVYYKKIDHYLDYVSGANLVMNHHIETDVIATKGKAYGLEFMVRKSLGRMNGWISYTYSRVLLKQGDSLAGEVVNNGKYYPSNYDKPHDVTMVFNYKFLHRLSVSVNATYSTGRPITVPIGRITYNNSQRTVFADRNSYRIPDYFRTDLSVNLDGNYKVHQKVHTSWTFGAYNLTGRRNPYSVYYVTEDGIINGYKLSVFGSIIPFVNFNLRF